MKPSRRLRLSCLVMLVLGLAACSQNSHPTIVLDPQLTESQKITYPASDAQLSAYFGSSVAVDGNLMVVGARGYRNTPTRSLGAAYLYQRDLTGSWQLIKKLLASDSSESMFGSSVAISGNTVVVGAPEDPVGTGYYGQGSAYIFERNRGGSNNWGETKKLLASDGGRFDNFGNSVAISGNTVVVGAYGNNIGDNSDQGSAYIFERNQGGVNTWGQVKRLLAGDGASNDGFGSSVAISGETVVVGASYSNGYQGSAYIFERDRGGSNNWGRGKKLIAGDGVVSNWFGYAVAISGKTIVVGAMFDTIGSNGYQGSAYIFERDQGGSNNWGQVKRLIASDGASYDYFGSSVGISGDTVLVGAASEYDYPNPSRAFIFTRNAGGSWIQAKKLFASDRRRYNHKRFGSSVAISGKTVVVGAMWDNIDGNGDQGSAYIFNY
jgi:hypothetical protein